MWQVIWYYLEYALFRCHRYNLYFFKLKVDIPYCGLHQGGQRTLETDREPPLVGVPGTNQIKVFYITPVPCQLLSFLMYWQWQRQARSKSKKGQNLQATASWHCPPSEPYFPAEDHTCRCSAASIKHSYRGLWLTRWWAGAWETQGSLLFMLLCFTEDREMQTGIETMGLCPVSVPQRDWLRALDFSFIL